MPNPFVRLQGVTSREYVRPVPMTPDQEESVERSQNHPYRGIETHGVPDTDSPSPTLGYNEGRPGVVYEAAPEDVEAVPVRVVNEKQRERRYARVLRAYASPLSNPTPQAIVGVDDDRLNVRVKNQTAATDIVYIGHSRETANPTFGYRLKVDEEYSTSSQGELYAYGMHATDVIPLGVTVDYVLEMAEQTP